MRVNHLEAIIVIVFVFVSLHFISNILRIFYGLMHTYTLLSEREEISIKHITIPSTRACLVASIRQLCVFDVCAFFLGFILFRENRYVLLLVCSLSSTCTVFFSLLTLFCFSLKWIRMISIINSLRLVHSDPLSPSSCVFSNRPHICTHGMHFIGRVEQKPFFNTMRLN